MDIANRNLVEESVIGRDRWRQPMQVFCRISLALILTVGMVGCQNGKRLFPNLRLANLPRVPAPSTGTLRMPNLAGSGSSPIANPPLQINPNSPSGSPSGGIKPGVFFQSGQQPYSSSQNNSGTQAIPVIPGRSSSGPNLSAAALGGPGAGTASGNGGSATAGSRIASANLRSNPLAGSSTQNPNVQTGTFDPFRTAGNPNWSNGSLANVALAGGSSPNQPVASTQQFSNPDSQKTGWYPGTNPQNGMQSSGGGVGTFSAQQPSAGQQNLAIGNGGILQNMNRSIKNFFTAQPANVGGFQTTAPVYDPRIYAGQGYQVAPASYQQAVGRQAGQIGTGVKVPLHSGAAGRVPMINQVQVNPNQVLGENSTSLIAENQARLGIRSPINNAQSGYSSGNSQAGGNVLPLGRPQIATTANLGDVNSQWQNVNAIR